MPRPSVGQHFYRSHQPINNTQPPDVAHRDARGPYSRALGRPLRAGDVLRRLASSTILLQPSQGEAQDHHPLSVDQSIQSRIPCRDGAGLSFPPHDRSPHPCRGAIGLSGRKLPVNDRTFHTTRRKRTVALRADWSARKASSTPDSTTGGSARKASSTSSKKAKQPQGELISLVDAPSQPYCWSTAPLICPAHLHRSSH